MHITTTDLGGADDATGTVVVIDVIRAFTTATVAAVAGAERIICVEDVEEAHALRHRLGPEVVLMGEVRGQRPDRFDLGNETDGPTATRVAGRTIVQRTSNGTRGLARAGRARHLLAGAAVNVSATSRWILAHAPGRPVTLVTTGSTSEDGAVARHLEALLRGADPDPNQLRREVLDAFVEHVAWRHRARASPGLDAFRADVARCAAVDRHDVALVARRDPEAAGHPVLAAWPMPP